MKESKVIAVINVVLITEAIVLLIPAMLELENHIDYTHASMVVMLVCFLFNLVVSTRGWRKAENVHEKKFNKNLY